MLTDAEIAGLVKMGHMTSELLELLDRIETTGDASLAGQFRDIAERHGLAIIVRDEQENLQ